MKVTPAWVSSFEANVQTFIVDAWTRVERNLVWDKFMEVRPSSTLRELYFWLVETAKIYPENQGGNKRYDDMAATFFEIDNANSGVGLQLTKNEIEDNMMASPNLRGMPSLDYAANWSKQVGGAGAYWPQDLLFNTLFANGLTANGYDGVPFFSASHPVNPISGNPGGLTYSNLIASKPLATATPSPGTAAADLIFAAGQNLTSVIASMRGYVQPNGKRRMLRPKYLIHDPSNLYMVGQLLDSKFWNANDNPFTKFGIEPVCVDELSGSPGVWYLTAELIEGEGGPFIFQDRDPYRLTSYSSDSQVELNRRKQYEWLYDGRNAGAYGHPYLCIRANPS